MTKCVFCGDLAERGGSLLEEWPFRLVVDRAPVSKWHLLLIAAEHIKSFSSFSAQELALASDIIERAKSILHRSLGYKYFVVGEHGLAWNSHGRRCGIDHAHLHIVPFKAPPLIHYAPDIARVEPLTGIRDLAQFSGKDYFFLESANQIPVIALAEWFEPQLFRRLIASSLRLEEYDWQSSMDDAAAKQTSQFLRPYFRSGS